MYQIILIAVLYTVHVRGSDDKQACEPISPKLTSPKTGQKAWDKCIEYQATLVYPCEKSPTRSNHCGHDSEALIVGGNLASNNEFPHIALLGYGDSTDIKWLCGGALISERFILTLGHCTAAREIGPVTYVLLGNVEANGKINQNNLYKIKNIIRHPEYRPPLKYNDIALLETEKQMELNQFRVPACLPVKEPEENVKTYDTSYVLASFGTSSNSNKIQKTQLSKFSTEECKTNYPLSRLLKRGFDENTQICYGKRNGSTDNCEGNSSGPLQVYNKNVSCMYDVIGVASFGRNCGFTQNPVVYTKVSYYVPWIESIVWP